MTRRRKIPVFAAALLAAGALASAAAKKPESKEPFFHQFLIPGDPLDDNLLAQEKRVAENPESAALRNDFGNLLAERRFPKEARAEYRKALELDKTFFLAAYNLGLMEETEGRVDAAISAYREAIDRRRGFPPAHFRLGRLYEKLGRTDDAVDEYAKAFRIDNSLRDPRRNPLVVDSRLMDRASLTNYQRDLARATQKRENEYVDAARFRPLPIERTLDTEEIVEEAGPQTIEAAPRSSGSARPGPTPARGRPAPTRPVRRDTTVRAPAPATAPAPVQEPAVQRPPMVPQEPTPVPEPESDEPQN
jgi:tetratricopeptide (TPR) repeat protein